MEVLVVVSITALIGAIVEPALGRGLAGAAFHQAASGLQADLRMARAQALRTAEEVDLVVDADGRGYGWSPGPQRMLVGRLSLSPAQAVVRFYPDGSTPGGVLRLADANATADFQVDPDLGVARDPS